MPLATGMASHSLRRPKSELVLSSAFSILSLSYNNIVALFPTTKGREDEDDVVLDNDCGRPNHQQTVRPTDQATAAVFIEPAGGPPPALRSPSANRSHVVTMNFSRSIAPSPKEEIVPFPLGLEGLIPLR